MHNLKEFTQGDFAEYINDYLGPYRNDNNISRTTIPEEAAKAIIATLYEVNSFSPYGPPRKRMGTGKEMAQGVRFSNKGFVCYLDDGNTKHFLSSHDFNWYLYIVRVE